MPVEIERKFLVKNDAWRAQVTHSERLRDGLVAREGDLKVRVRCYGNRATLCVKSGRQRLAREEFEYEIPPDHAEAIFAHCTGRILEKTRHYVPGPSGVWEIDVYHDLLDGVVIAEIELDSESATVHLPDWIGEEITGTRATARPTCWTRARTVSDDQSATSLRAKRLVRHSPKGDGGSNPVPTRKSGFASSLRSSQ